jgi:hypothetical protein
MLGSLRDDSPGLEHTGMGYRFVGEEKIEVPGEFVLSSKKMANF